METISSTPTEQALSVIAAEIWGVPPTTPYGYPLVQEVGGGTYAAYLSHYGIMGSGDTWRVVFAEDGVAVSGNTYTLEAALAEAIAAEC